jgi:hypothetical protein
VTIEFAAGANDKSKVVFLCYGSDANGNPVETPFNQGTLFVVPEYATPILGVAACFAAYKFSRPEHTQSFQVNLKMFSSDTAEGRSAKIAPFFLSNKTAKIYNHNDVTAGINRKGPRRRAFF